MKFATTRHAIAVLWLLAGCCAGCGSSKTGFERYIPAPDQARSAIAASLEAWKRGEPVGEVKGTKPIVYVADTSRQEGQTLERFEILGEVNGLTERTFLVKLQFANPAAEQKARYCVLGIDPLWVYRHEDLELLTHWEHPMPKTSEASKDAAKSPNNTETSP